MDLGLSGRAVWLFLDDSPAAWAIAETCLEEGASVALVAGRIGAEGTARRAALAARFGLRLRLVSCDQAMPPVVPVPADLVHWAGWPAAIITFCPRKLRLGEGPRQGRFQGSYVGSLQRGGALVLLEVNWRGEEEEDRGLSALRQARLRWEARAAEGVRVSVVAAPRGVTRHATPGSMGRCERAVADLVVFLAARGFGSTAAVSEQGAVQLF